jgi:hypothetical protein
MDSLKAISAREYQATTTESALMDLKANAINDHQQPNQAVEEHVFAEIDPSGAARQAHPCPIDIPAAATYIRAVSAARLPHWTPGAGSHAKGQSSRYRHLL